MSLRTSENGLIAKAVTLAAIEVLEGTARQPRWKRRRLKGIWPEQGPSKPKHPGKPRMTNREVEKAIAAALKEVGYTKARGETGIFLKPLTEDVAGWVFDQRGPRPTHPQRLPVALLVAGRPDEARAALDGELAKIDGKTDSAAQAFRQFAERLEPELLTPTTQDS